MISDSVGDEARCESGGKGYDLRMLRRSGLFVHAGKTYYFCSDECASKFRSNPDSFVSR